MTDFGDCSSSTWWTVYKVDCSDRKKNPPLLTIFSRRCASLLCVIWHIPWFIKKTDHTVTLHYPSPLFGRACCSCECYTVTSVSSLSDQYPLRLAMNPCSIINIRSNPCTLNLCRILSTLTGITFGALSAKWNYSMRTDRRLTINNITWYWRLMGYYPKEFHHLQAGINLSHHGWTTVAAPEWPSMS